MNFGNNLKNMRKNAKISQEVLAEKIGVTRQSVSKWETGEAYPEMSNIVALTKIFHCEITDLINNNITDSESFDDKTKKEIIKFKKNQQVLMRRISKSIYIIANICKIIVAIPTVVLILISLIFPFFISSFKITSNEISIKDKFISYSINDNVLEISGEKRYIDTSTDVKEFLSSHNSRYFAWCIEYILIVGSVLCVLTVLVLHSIYSLYKNIYTDEQPFNLKNEKIVRLGVLFYAIEFIVMKLTAVLFMLVTKVDLAIDFNIKDVISILVVISIVYLFKYGRMIQAESNAKIYG